jgi:hypothetical protein
MELRATCNACSRALDLGQAIAVGPLQGLCPWCGSPLIPQNTARLVKGVTGVVRSLEDLLAALDILLVRPRRFEPLFDDLTRAFANEVTPNADSGVDQPTPPGQ